MMYINSLLEEVTGRGVSDLHITAGVPPIIRERGFLRKFGSRALNGEDTEKILRQLLNEDQLKIFEEKGEVDFSYNLTGLGYFRVNGYRQRGSVGIAIRVLNTKIVTLKELEMPDTLATMAMRNQGLILVTGPTGSGKSTTLAAMTDLINSNKENHIITLEDPIEYVHKHKKSVVTQREIGQDSNTFPAALRAALRQDPDVILVGEMRDLETISIAVTAAETGHLVLATLHTNDSAQSVERIIDSFPSNQQHQIRTQLANSLVGIVSQRLIPRRDDSGRIAAVEVLLCNNAVRNLIREGKIHQIPSTMQICASQGMLTMDKCLQNLYQKGKISKDIVLEYARDDEAMHSFFKSSCIA